MKPKNEWRRKKMIDFDDVRRQFAEYLAQNADKRHSLDAALMHVVERAYQQGQTDAQRHGGAVDGWKEATVAWAVCTSIHKRFAGRDALYKTRHADFVRHEAEARAAYQTYSAYDDLQQKTKTSIAINSMAYDAFEQALNNNP